MTTGRINQVAIGQQTSQNETSVTRPLSREKLSSHCREMTSEFCAVSNRNCVPTRRRDRSLTVVSESREKFPRKYSLPPIATAAGELKGWFLTQGATPAALPKRRPGSRYRVRPSQDAVRLVETLDMTDTKLLRTHCLCRRFHVGLLAGNSKISGPGSHSFVSNKWG